MAKKRSGAAGTPLTTQGRRLALLLCNGDYRDPGLPKLPGVKVDEKRFREVLSEPETCGFSVRSLLDQGLLDVRRAVAETCAEAGETDTLLVYYSGSSFRGDDGSLYLPVADSDRAYADATALDAEFILGRLRRSRCRRIVLLVDGCHSGAFFNNNRGIPDGLFAITACGADELTGDTPQGGAFTQALVAGLRNAAADRDGDGLVTIDELHQFAKEYLAQSGFGSTPQKWIWNVPGPIYLAGAPKHVFLSYAREDEDAAVRMVKALEDEGLSVWIDREDIDSGSWKERVTAGLNRARALVFLMTPIALASGAVRKELAFAAKKGVPILPVALEVLPEDELPDWYTLDYDELHRHLIPPAGLAAGAKKLAAAIRRARRETAGG